MRKHIRNIISALLIVAILVELLYVPDYTVYAGENTNRNNEKYSSEYDEIRINLDDNQDEETLDGGSVDKDGNDSKGTDSIENDDEITLKEDEINDVVMEQIVNNLSEQFGELNVTKTDDGYLINDGLEDDEILSYDEEAAEYISQQGGEYIGNLGNTNVAISKAPEGDENTAPFDPSVAEDITNQFYEDLYNAFTYEPLDSEIIDDAIAQADALAEYSTFDDFADEEAGSLMAEDLNIEEVEWTENDFSDIYYEQIEGLGSISTDGLGSQSKGELTVASDDQLLINVQDDQGKPLSDASILIKYKDSNGKIQTKKGVTSQGTETKPGGMCVFTDMKGSYEGFLDIQKSGYHISTSFNTDLSGGNTITRKLKKNEDNDVYIRAVDLEGADLLNEETEITLYRKVQNYRLTVLVTCVGDSSNNNTVKLVAKNNDNDEPYREKFTIPQIGEYNNSSLTNADNCKTYKFESSKAWGSRGQKLLVHNDRLYISIGDNEFELAAKAKNPVVDNVFFNDLGIGLTGGGISVKFPSKVPVIGGEEVSVDIIKIPVQILVLPSGLVCISTNFSKDKNGGWVPEDAAFAELKSYIDDGVELDPSATKKCKNLIDEFAESMDKLDQNIKNVPYYSKSAKTGFDRFGAVKYKVMVSGVGYYDPDVSELVIGLRVGLGLSAGFSTVWYMICPLGPLHIGFELAGSLEGAIGISVGAKPSNIIDTIHVVPTSSDLRPGSIPGGSSLSGLSVTLAIAITLFVGWGYRGMKNGFCVDGEGQIGVTGTLSFSPRDESDLYDFPADDKSAGVPRVSASFFYRLSVSVYMLYISWKHDFLADKILLYDSWDKYKKHTVDEIQDLAVSAFDGSDPDAELESVDLSKSSEEIVDGINDIGTTDLLADHVSNDASDVEQATKIAYGVLADNQANIVMISDSVGAVVRIASVDNKLCLLYSKIEDGKIDNQWKRIPLPDGAPDYVFSYSVSKKPGSNNLFFGIISGDYIEDGEDNTLPERRAKSCAVSAVTFDIVNNQVIEKNLIYKLADVDGKQIYGLKSIAGLDNKTKLAWLESSEFSPILFNRKATFCYYDGNEYEEGQKFYREQMQVPFFYASDIEKELFPTIWLMTDGNGKMTPWDKGFDKVWKYVNYTANASDYSFTAPISVDEDGNKNYYSTYVSFDSDQMGYKLFRSEYAPAFANITDGGINYTTFYDDMYADKCYSYTTAVEHIDPEKELDFRDSDNNVQLFASERKGLALVKTVNKYKKEVGEDAENKNEYDYTEVSVYRITFVDRNSSKKALVADPLVYKINMGGVTNNAAVACYKKDIGHIFKSSLSGYYILGNVITSEANRKSNLNIWHSDENESFKINSFSLGTAGVKKGESVKVYFQAQNYGHDENGFLFRLKDKNGNSIKIDSANFDVYNTSSSNANFDGVYWNEFEDFSPSFIPGVVVNGTLTFTVPKNWSGDQTVILEVRGRHDLLKAGNSGEGAPEENSNDLSIDSESIYINKSNASLLRMNAVLTNHHGESYAEIEVDNDSLVVGDYVKLSVYADLDDAYSRSFSEEEVGDDKNVRPIGEYWINNGDERRALNDETHKCNFLIPVDHLWEDSTSASSLKFVLTEWNEGGSPIVRSITSLSHPDYDYNFSIDGLPNVNERGTVLGGESVNDEGTVTLTAKANEGFSFTEWKKIDYIEQSADGRENVYILSELPDNCSVDADRNLIVSYNDDEEDMLFCAVFEDANTHNRFQVVTGEYPGQTYTGDGGDVTVDNAIALTEYSVEMGDVTHRGYRYSALKGDTVTLSANPLGDTKLKGWYDDNDHLISKEYTLEIDPSLYQDKTITAVFEMDDLLPTEDTVFASYSDAKDSGAYEDLCANAQKLIKADDFSSICGRVDWDSSQSYWVRIRATEKMVNSFERSITFRADEETDITAPIETYWDGSYYNIKLNKPGYFLFTWSDSKVNISFDANGGEDISTTIELVRGEVYGNLPTPVRSGYRFLGWYTHAAGGEKIEEDDPVDTDSELDVAETLYAHWRIDGYVMDVEDIPEYTYTGKKIIPLVNVYNDDELLVAGKDYTVSYTNNVNAGQATATITGKGNYSGKIVKTFTINKADLNNAVCDDIIRTFNGSVQKPAPSVKYGSATLKNNKDFTYSYEGECKEAGLYKITIEGINNYTGSLSANLRIFASDEKPMSKVTVRGLNSLQYDGNSHIPTAEMLTVKYGSYTLKYNEDYLIQAYDSCINAGVHSIVLMGMGKFYGNKKITLTIKGTSINKAKMNPVSVVYNGKSQTPEIVLTYKGTKLIKDKDYRLQYSNNINAGKGKVTINGMGRFVGTVTKTFNITPVVLEDSFVETSLSANYIAGGTIVEPTVTYRNKVLVKNVDYKLSYKNNKKVTDKAVVTIKGINNFSGQINRNYTIVAKNLNELPMILPDLEYSGLKGKYTTGILIFDNGRLLKSGSDYDKNVKYYKGEELLNSKSIVQVGDVITVMVSGKSNGNYIGTTTGTFKIVEKGKNLSKAKLSSGIIMYFTGTPRELTKSDISLVLNKTAVPESSFSIIDNSYSDNVNKGNATVYLKGENGYAGVLKIKYKISPQIVKNQ